MIFSAVSKLVLIWLRYMMWLVIEAVVETGGKKADICRLDHMSTSYLMAIIPHHFQ